MPVTTVAHTAYKNLLAAENGEKTKSPWNHEIWAFLKMYHIPGRPNSIKYNLLAARVIATKLSRYVARAQASTMLEGSLKLACLSGDTSIFSLP